jgi:hypothetical protein
MGLVGGVVAEKIPVPADVVALQLLDRVDYQDAFSAETTASRTPVEWARLALEDAPPALLNLIRPLLMALGLRPATGEGPSSADRILGWRILHCDEAHIVLGVDAQFGAPRIVFSAPPGQVVMTTQLQFDQSGFGTVWAAVGWIHRRVARYLIDRAVRVGPPT